MPHAASGRGGIASADTERIQSGYRYEQQPHTGSVSMAGSGEWSVKAGVGQRKAGVVSLVQYQRRPRLSKRVRRSPLGGCATHCAIGTPHLRPFSPTPVDQVRLGKSRRVIRKLLCNLTNQSAACSRYTQRSRRQNSAGGLQRHTGSGRCPQFLLIDLRIAVLYLNPLMRRRCVMQRRSASCASAPRLVPAAPCPCRAGLALPVPAGGCICRRCPWRFVLEAACAIMRAPHSVPCLLF